MLLSFSCCLCYNHDCQKQANRHFMLGVCMGHFFKTTISFMLLTSLCICAAGCTGNSREEISDAPVISTESSAPETETPDIDVPEATPNIPEETPPAPPEPLNISTNGGVVIVGTVCHDDAGWFLVPEQPLNVEYHYFLDHPTQFDALQRIELFDPTIDGVEKLLYLGETVTVEGTFRFYRDYFDKLYILPYSIHLGKNVQESYAAPDLQAPDLTLNRYDPSTPLPKYMDPMVREGQFVYNAFMLSLESLELMGNDFAVFYCDFVDAFLNYRTECPCPDKEFAEMLATIIYFEFPLYDVCAESFEFVKHYDADEEKVILTYKYDQATHQQKIDTFMAAANEFLATTSPKQSEAELAKNIYHELCTRVTYDHSALEDFERKNAFYAYMDHSGVCVTFANVYNQLLTQVGIRATTAQCDYTPTMGHIWSLITIDGNQYFCDPTFELNYDEGSGYRYFGQTYAQRLADGLGTDGMTAGRYYPYPVDESLLSSVPLASSSDTNETVCVAEGFFQLNT